MQAEGKKCVRFSRMEKNILDLRRPILVVTSRGLLVREKLGKRQQLGDTVLQGTLQYRSSTVLGTVVL
jgi:hypothetical protein